MVRQYSSDYRFDSYHSLYSTNTFLHVRHNMENNYEGDTSTNKDRASGRTYLYKREYVLDIDIDRAKHILALFLDREVK